MAIPPEIAHRSSEGTARSYGFIVERGGGTAKAEILPLLSPLPSTMDGEPIHNS
jgi:hypothetical protein